MLWGEGGVLAGRGIQSATTRSGPARLLTQTRPFSRSLMCGSRSRCGVEPELETNRKNKQNLKDTEENAGSVLSVSAQLAQLNRASSLKAQTVFTHLFPLLSSRVGLVNCLLNCR